MKQVLVRGNNPYMAQNNQLLLTIEMMIMLEVKLIMIQGVFLTGTPLKS